VDCDPSIKAIILKIDAALHDFIIEDLDEQTLVVKESKLKELQQRLDAVRIISFFFLFLFFYLLLSVSYINSPIFSRVFLSFSPVLLFCPFLPFFFHLSFPPTPKTSLFSFAFLFHLFTSS
jgi:TFIIH basal transcription factor complex TTD-A subunit